jgi:hypothetical protein
MIRRSCAIDLCPTAEVMGVSAPIATVATLHRMDMLRMEAAVSASLTM